ncbi:KH domain-containing protein At4g18375 [Linum grandiflorum]
MAGERSSYGKRSHSRSEYDNGPSKRRSSGEDRDPFIIDARDTVYRYLCPGRKIGSIIGRGGDIIKQLRIDTKSKIRIGETVRSCDDRVVTIYSSSDLTNTYGDSGDEISPAQDALFRVHDKVVAEDLHGGEDSQSGHQVTARLLVPSDQIGCIIGKEGKIVQNIRADTGTQIRILKDDHLPLCALRSDELVQISGEAASVKQALHQIALRLHENPSRSQHLLGSAVPNMHSSGGSLMGPAAGPQFVGIAPLVSSYGGYKNDARDWSQPMYSTQREELPPREFSLRIVCPAGNIGGVIGKGGAIINQIRQESGAGIKVDSSAADGDECLIAISAREVFDEQYSPTIEAALRLQPRCSERTERDSGLISYTTRLLVPSSRIGCLLGKGGAIINEMRQQTKANIRILGKEDVPKVAANDEEMVQISGDLDVAKDALIQVSQRLRANVFDREGATSTFLPVVPYVPVSADAPDHLNYDSRDGRRVGRGYSFSGDYSSSDTYGSYYSNPQIGGGGAPYGAYGSYSSGRTSTSG